MCFYHNFKYALRILKFRRRGWSAWRKVPLRATWKPGALKQRPCTQTGSCPQWLPLQTEKQPASLDFSNHLHPLVFLIHKKNWSIINN
jgi:hypothetical protein